MWLENVEIRTRRARLFVVKPNYKIQYCNTVGTQIRSTCFLQGAYETAPPRRLGVRVAFEPGDYRCYCVYYTTAKYAYTHVFPGSASRNVCQMCVHLNREAVRNNYDTLWYIVIRNTGTFTRVVILLYICTHFFVVTVSIWREMTQKPTWKPGTRNSAAILLFPAKKQKQWFPSPDVCNDRRK